MIQTNELAWASYAFANEAFTVCGMGTFIPICLQEILGQFGVEKGSYMPCVELSNCHIVFGIFKIDITSFVLYTIAISVLFQAIFMVYFSSFIDKYHAQRRFLLGFGWAGALATMCFIFKSTFLLTAPILVIVGNVCFGMTMVCLNGLLKTLVKKFLEMVIL